MPLANERRVADKPLVRAASPFARRESFRLRHALKRLPFSTRSKKIALAPLQKIAVGFWMSELGRNVESAPLVVKRLLAGFHVHTN